MLKRPRASLARFPIQTASRKVADSGRRPPDNLLAASAGRCPVTQGRPPPSQRCPTAAGGLTCRDDEGVDSEREQDAARERDAHPGKGGSAHGASHGVLVAGCNSASESHITLSAASCGPRGGQGVPSKSSRRPSARRPDAPHRSKTTTHTTSMFGRCS